MLDTLENGDQQDDNPLRRRDDGEKAQLDLPRILLGHVLEQAVYVAFQLGLPSVLGDKLWDVERLAMHVGAHPGTLRMVLRALTANGILHESVDGKFGNTPLSSNLMSDSSSVTARRIAFYSLPEVWQSWGNTLHSVRTGESAFKGTHRQSFYDFLGRNPKVRSAFHEYMSAISRIDTPPFVDAFDFTAIDHVMDVGGGYGDTLTAVLRANPHLAGTLFDLPEVIEEAARRTPDDVRARVTATAGDLRVSLPDGASMYLVKSVLCDWPDDTVVDILRACARAMRDDGRLVIVEKLSDDTDPISDYERLMDLHILGLCGGHGLRAAADYRRLFALAGLQIHALTRIGSGMSVLEGLRA